MNPNVNACRGRAAFAASALLIIAVSAPGAWAYRYATCNGHAQTWSTDGRTFTPLRVSFPAGADSESALYMTQFAYDLFAPGSPFDVALAYTTRTTWGGGNGHNDVAFTNDYGWASGDLAVCITRYKSCFWWSDTGGIAETDVMFRPNQNWDYSSTNSGNDSSKPSFRTVAIHEFGHALGLKHENGWIATMNSFYPNGGPLGGHHHAAHADDLNGARYLYGSHNSARDVAASAFRATGSGTSAPIAAPASVKKGTTIAMPFTLSNRGTKSESAVLVTARLGGVFPLGSNVADLGSTILAINQGEWTVTLYGTIPTSVPTGYYFLKACVDPTNTIGELEEGNNCAAYYKLTYVY